MRDMRFGENNNRERLQLLFNQLVMGMPDDRQTIDNFGRWVEQKGEEWARAQLGIVRDGYPTVLEDGEGKEFTVTFSMCMGGDLTFHAASPQEALERFRQVAPERLAIECCFDDCVEVHGITDEDGKELRPEEIEAEEAEEDK